MLHAKKFIPRLFIIMSEILGRWEKFGSGSGHIDEDLFVQAVCRQCAVSLAGCATSQSAASYPTTPDLADIMEQPNSTRGTPTKRTRQPEDKLKAKLAKGQYTERVSATVTKLVLIFVRDR